MKESGVKFSQFLKRNNIKLNIDKNLLESLYLNKVNIYINSKVIDICLKSPTIVHDKYITQIKNFFIEEFKQFTVKLSLQYVNWGDKLEEIWKKYWPNILFLIEQNLPSSNSWLKDLEYTLHENFLTLFPTSIIIKHTLESNNIIKKIEEKVRNELGVHFIVQVDDSKIENNNGEILEQSFMEEKELSKNMVNHVLEKAKTKKSREEIRIKDYSFGRKISQDPMKIKDINFDTGQAVIEGEVFQIESRDIRGNRKLVTFNLTDTTDSMTAKVFLRENQYEEFISNVKEGSYVKISGDIIYDNYSNHLVLMLKSLNILEKEERMDLSKEKRIELHLHTQMSSLDGISSFKEYAKRAKKWGHKALAITDHGVVQGFPEAMEASKDLGLKIIYGVEAYLINDSKKIITNYKEKEKYDKYVVFDIETTGLSPKEDAITEIGAIKIENGVIVDEYNQLINPEKPIPKKIMELTGITDEMVQDQPKIDSVLPKFKEFIEDSVLVAHNASFDTGFLREQFLNNNMTFDYPILDTLELTRALFPNLTNHRLNTIAKYLNVSLINHHRAVDDAKATAEIFLKCMTILEENNIKDFKSLNKLNSNLDINKERPYHATILVRDTVGLKNLYKLISESHLNYFYRRPRIPKSLVEKYREGLLIGSACEAGELYQGLLSNKSNKEIEEIVGFYDYLEIQPLANNYHLIRNGMVKDEDGLKAINRKIIELGERYNKLVVATGDVHYLEPEEAINRKILLSGQGFKDVEEQAPLFFKTTDEMLDDFSYLGEEMAKKVVIFNPNKINEMIEDIDPIPSGTYPPVIEGADKELKELTYKKAFEIYGNPLPNIVKTRLDRELDSIISNGYAVMYIIAQKLVWKSLEDGYLVGSRGSVGSSFVATMSGITEVNPLPPHYVCPKCKYSQFFQDGSVGSGVDLPEKECPECSHQLNKDGHDIPFEVFLGFEGDKEPDIDLNFAGEYQAEAHKYTEELFGEDYVYRAGTIGTIAEKTAYGFVKKYFEEKGENPHPAEINRLVKGLTGIKRTSGQHPGGVMIVPKHKDILDFTPIQYPADDKKAGVITTHFDYNAIEGRILKLDVLGHDVPSIIRMLEDITGVDPQEIPLDDEKTMKLFTSSEPLNIKDENVKLETGTLGIPEFGTRFVRQMLVETQPTSFSELVRISGLSHGTDVWINNAQNLVRDNIASLSEVISTRDDIMLYLIYSGLDKKTAFKIMENVRRGRGLSEEDEKYMRAHNIPEWYIDSCQKIKYMFPKAHAVAYVMMSFRIAYFKVYYPEAFYTTYFTTKAQDFDAHLVLQGPQVVREKIKELESLGNKATAKERNLLIVLEVVEEMFGRGLQFEKVDLYKSHSDKFLIGEDGIIPPLICLDGVGDTAAKKIVEERNKAKFISIEDLVNRSKISKTVLNALKDHGCLSELPESNQISLFNI